MPELNYHQLEDVLDDGRLPVVLNLHDGRVYWCSYSVQEWSPVLTGDDEERERQVVQAIVATDYIRRQNGDS